MLRQETQQPRHFEAIEWRRLSEGHIACALEAADALNEDTGALVALGRSGGDRTASVLFGLLEALMDACIDDPFTRQGHTTTSHHLP